MNQFCSLLNIEGFIKCFFTKSCELDALLQLPVNWNSRDCRSPFFGSLYLIPKFVVQAIMKHAHPMCQEAFLHYLFADFRRFFVFASISQAARHAGHNQLLHVDERMDAVFEDALSGDALKQV